MQPIETYVSRNKKVQVNRLYFQPLLKEKNERCCSLVSLIVQKPKITFCRKSTNNKTNQKRSIFSKLSKKSLDFGNMYIYIDLRITAVPTFASRSDKQSCALPPLGAWHPLFIFFSLQLARTFCDLPLCAYHDFTHTLLSRLLSVHNCIVTFIMYVCWACTHNLYIFIFTCKCGGPSEWVSADKICPVIPKHCCIPLHDPCQVCLPSWNPCQGGRIDTTK